ncbi:MAG: hypothetical protein ACLGPM_01560 [Acidobacteriota bacterium]
MLLSRYAWLAGLLLCVPAAGFAKTPKQCFTADQASRMVNKDVCVSVHVYDVVALPDGTRFLDVCSPETPDEKCNFTIISRWGDHEQVGELQKYRDQNVHIRGIVRPMNGRAGMVLSHARQFYGGPPRFRPNPLLSRGFDATQNRPPIRDPNLRHRGGRRAFMNSRDQEPVPAK